MKRKIVLIKWIDSMNSAGWGKKPICNLNCVTAGLLVERTKECIVIALSTSAECDGHYITIPMAAVKSVKIIGTVDQPKP